MSEILSVDNLATGYGDVRVVWDVSFQVQPGQIVALLGRNGAGKTTILRAIMGLNRTDGGSISFEGALLDRTPPYKRVAAGIGIVQEGKRLIGAISVQENLLLGAHSSPLRGRGLTDRLEWAYQLFPALASRRSHAAAALSGGQQQMLAIAQALMPGPILLLVDEPSAGLAPAIVGDVLEILTNLRDDGVAIVLVEQSVDFALAAASHAVVVDLGNVVYSSPTDVPGIRAKVQEAYLGRLEGPSHG